MFWIHKSSLTKHKHPHWVNLSSLKLLLGTTVKIWVSHEQDFLNFKAAPYLNAAIFASQIFKKTCAFFFFFMQLAHVATLTYETNSCHLRKTSCCWRRRHLRFTFLWNRSLQLLQRRKPLSHRGGKHKVLDNVLPAHYKKNIFFAQRDDVWAVGE